MHEFLTRKLEPVGKIHKGELQSMWSDSHPEHAHLFHRLIQSQMSIGRLAASRDFYMTKKKSES